MSAQRRVRVLLVVVFVPVLIVVGVLATAVLGQDRAGDRAGGGTVTGSASAPAAAVPARDAPANAAPVAPPAPAPAHPPAAAPTPPAPVEPPPAASGYALRDVEREDVGSGARAAAIFRPRGASWHPRPVVIFLHGWVAIDPERYGPWIAHLVRNGSTVIYPTYQTKPTRDTVTPLANVLAGVRSALERVAIVSGRLVVAGHSAGGALAADYAAVAAANALPAPAVVFSVYPGRRLRHLTTTIPEFDLVSIAPGTRVVAYVGERDSAVGSTTAKQIVEGAVQADAQLQVVREDAVDDHSAPRRFDRAAQRTFWEPLDALIAATAETAPTAADLAGDSSSR